MTTTTLLRDHIGHTLAEAMRRDPHVVLVGEDVADGGMFGWSLAPTEDDALRSRVLSTPLVPSTFVAYAGGLALGGARPVVLLPGLQSLCDGWAGLREVIRRSQHHPLPLLIIAPVGPGLEPSPLDAEDDDGGLEASLAAMGELRVIVAGSPPVVPALLRAAIEFWAGEQPTLLLIPRRHLLQPLAEAVTELDRPFGVPQVLREGPEATVFAWGETLQRAMTAVEHSGIDATIVDVESLAPLHRERLVELAARTGKIVIAAPGTSPHGVAAELGALFGDAAITSLDAPVLRIGGDQTADTLENRQLPAPEAIAAALRQVAYY